MSHYCSLGSAWSSWCFALLKLLSYPPWGNFLAYGLIWHDLYNVFCVCGCSLSFVLFQFFAFGFCCPKCNPVCEKTLSCPQAKKKLLKIIWKVKKLVKSLNIVNKINQWSNQTPLVALVGALLLWTRLLPYMQWIIDDFSYTLLLFSNNTTKAIFS